MNLKQRLQLLNRFDSVHHFNALQALKKVYLRNIKNGNKTNDILDYPDLIPKYDKLEKEYRQIVKIDSNIENYVDLLKQRIVLLKELAEEETYTLKHTNKGRVDGFKKSNALYMYKTINWRENEEKRLFKVSRIDEGIVEKEVLRTKNKAYTQQRLYLGPMDLAFYPHFSETYYLKSSMLFAYLLNLELLIVQQIEMESNYVKEKSLELTLIEQTDILELQKQIKNYYKNKYTKKYGKLFISNFNEYIELLAQSIDLWKEKHQCIYLYYKVKANHELITEIQLLLSPIVVSEDDEKVQNELIRLNKYQNRILNKIQKIHPELEVINESNITDSFNNCILSLNKKMRIHHVRLNKFFSNKQGI